MSDAKMAVQIKPVRDPNGKESLKATVPLHLMFAKNFDANRLNKQLKEFEDRYLKLVDSLKSIVKLIKARERKGRVLLYWMFGDEIHDFTDGNKSGALSVENLTAHLVRDTSVSEKMIGRCKKFRFLYPDINKIDLNKSFNSYVETFEGGYVSVKRRQEKNLNPKTLDPKIVG